MENKPCYRCGSLEDVRETLNKYTKKDGTVSIYPSYLCKSCNSKNSRRHYATCKLLVFQHYGQQCVCCGERELSFLTIDHVNNDGKSDVWESGIRITGIKLYARIVKNNFPIKYQVMCMNCNFGKRMNAGVCPHKMI